MEQGTVPIMFEKCREWLLISRKSTKNFICTPSAIRKCLYFDWKQKCKTNNIPIDKLIAGITIGPRSRITRQKLKDYLLEKGLESLAKRVRKSESTLK